MVINTQNFMGQNKMTLSQLNKIAKEHNLELVKGAGYFYWVKIDGTIPDIPSVMIYAFCHADRKFWMNELKSAI